MSLFGSRSKTSKERQSSGFHQPKTVLYSHSEANKLMGFRNMQSVGSGLVNLGNSCFMNSCLQCLVYTPPLQNYISSNHHTRKCVTSSFCLFCQLHKDLPTILGKVKGSSFSPTSIFRSLSKISSCLHPGRQEDAHEFLMNTLDMLQKNALKCHGRKIKDERVKETSVVHRIFGGYLRSQVKCLHCKYESNTYDSCLHMSLEISAGRSVYRALRQFTLSERLSGANKYFCENCNHKQEASKQMTIFEPPLILILHLKRFSFMSGVREFAGYGLFSRHGSGKINKFISYDEALSLDPFMSYKHPGGVNYSLCGVLVHAGMSMNSGHYYSYIKSPAGDWHQMNDSLVRKCTINDVLEQKAYMLFYTRIEEKKPYRSPQTTPQKSLPKSPLEEVAAVKKPNLPSTSAASIKRQKALLKLRLRHRNYSLSSSSNSSSSSRNASAMALSSSSSRNTSSIAPPSSRAISYITQQRARQERMPIARPSLPNGSPHRLKRPQVRLKKPGELLSLYRPSKPIKTATNRSPHRKPKANLDTLHWRPYPTSTRKQGNLRSTAFSDEKDLLSRLRRLTVDKAPRRMRKSKRSPLSRS